MQYVACGSLLHGDIALAVDEQNQVILHVDICRSPAPRTSEEKYKDND